MGLLNWAFAGAIGYGLYRYANSANGRAQHAGFAPGETNGENFAKVRNAGPESMRSDPPRWDDQDQRSDESFPASDPPATY
jgi:hypothetical protein